MFLEFLAVFAVACVFCIPGILLAFGLLHGIQLSKLNKTIIGIIFGLLANPVLSYFEFAVFGAKLSSGLIPANALFIAFAGLALLYAQGQLRELQSKATRLRKGLRGFDARAWARANAASILLIVVLLASFYPRFAASWTTDFFEFDPYLYTFTTQYLVKDGVIPLATNDSYYPELRSHRTYPLVHYMTGSWYLVYKDFLGFSYQKDTLILAAQLYPALIAVLLAFLVFLLVKEIYNQWAGLVTAALFAFTPQLIKKFAAGVAELQPFGLFAAIMLLALFALAVNRSSLRLGLLAGFAALASILGSAQYIWPFAIVAGYIFFQSLFDFWHNKTSKRSLAVYSFVAAGALFGNFFLAAYQGKDVLAGFFKNPFDFLLGGVITHAVLFLLASLVVPVFFFIAKDFHFKKSALAFQEKTRVLGALAALILVIAAATPLGSTAYGYVFAGLQFARAGSPLMMTVAEENPTSPGVFGPAYGVLNPHLFLALTAVFGAIAFIAYFFGERNKLLLLFLLVIFPVSYIGLNKLKYMVHLGLVLTIAAGFVLGELAKSWGRFNNWLKLGVKEQTLQTAGFWSVAALGLLLVAPQLATISDSMRELNYTRLPQDWLDAMTWLRTSSPTNIRVLSWWDYGHWTMFLGERHTVLDPGNVYDKFDWETAHAFVDGSTEDLYNTISYHKAPNETSYVMVDGELIGKWGALVFQSGVYNAQILNRTGKAGIENWHQGPGKSKYEMEHYFEYLNYAGQCPAFASPIPMPMLQSSFGATYCMAQNELLLLTRSGIDYNFKRLYKVAGRDQITEVDANTSYLFSLGQGKFLNVNPDLRYAGMESKLVNAAYVRLYFFENLPGFELVYRSPQGLVKIFRTKEELLKHCAKWPPQLC